jgi:hypothetical protein
MGTTVIPGGLNVVSHPVERGVESPPSITGMDDGKVTPGVALSPSPVCSEEARIGSRGRVVPGHRAFVAPDSSGSRWRESSSFRRRSEV